MFTKDFHQIWVNIEFDLRALKNYFWSVAADLILKPFLYVTLLSAGLSGYIHSVSAMGQEEILRFLFPGVTATLFCGLFSNVVNSCAIERRWGILAIKRRAGLTRYNHVVSLTLLNLLMFWLQFLCAAIGLLMVIGTMVNVFFLGQLLIRGSLCAIFWIHLGIAVSSAIPNYKTRDALLSIVIFPLIYTAPTFYPLESAPTYLAALATLNPLTYQLELLRSKEAAGDDLALFIVTGTLTLLASALAINRLIRIDDCATELA